jgi:hypothetical protein
LGKDIEEIMTAFFIYSDGSSKQLTFPSMLGVKKKVNERLLIEPILVYFEGRPTPEQEGSVELCKDITRWQHWCLRQTRSYEV